MKIQFDSNLDFQREAIDSIVNIFKGQPLASSNFTVENRLNQMALNGLEPGVSNKLVLDMEDMLKNVQAIQLKNGLEQTKKLGKNNLHFTVEMETGTGKTYVYLRTVFELNKQYGFTKFIIVVPSIAIKEGVYKTLQMTEEHFKVLYDNVIYEYFTYDSQKLEQVRNFAVSDNIQIMVINIDAFRRSFTDPSKETKANIIHRPNDRLNGNKPIELIQETNPIVIIDEPQSVDTTSKSREAIGSLNPICTLRYSATHKDKHNLMYKLDAVDAYERQLVKQIEVASVISKDHHNDAYIKLISVDNKKYPITAKLEIDALERGNIRRKAVTVKQGDDLFELSGGRELYSGYIINNIYCEKGNEYVDFTSQEDILRLDEKIGEMDDDAIKRAQIIKTIEQHLDKELSLRKQGIKVLSLFFIDKVANYRYYNKNGNPHKGKYAIWFEEEYKKLIQKPKYRDLAEEVDLESHTEAVHNGYFAVDRKGLYKDTSGNTLADEDIFNLIMKDKERLLSFDSRLKFIFSHSALKEGWDNPNVFQICTLNETKSEMKKRQEIGRGLRLAVNQKGERIHGFDVNTLTVMANESYEDFAKTLQKEYEEESGIRFGIVEKHSFANITFEDYNGELVYLQQDRSKQLWNHLKDKGYIDDNGKVTDELKRDLKENKVDIPDGFSNVKDKIIVTLRKIAGSLNIKNADDRKKIRLNKKVYLGPEFIELWERIRHKTTYSVKFDTEELIDTCSTEIRDNLRVDKPKLVFTKAELDVSVGGVKVKERDRSAMVVKESKVHLPDVLTYLQNETNLTRKTIAEILIKSGRLKDFKNNPQKFMTEVSQIIKSKMRRLLVDGIKYTKLGDDEFYAQELFEDEELSGYLSKNMLESEKSVYEYVVYDSEVEKDFAQKFENNQSVRVYAKLPDWFKIETPLGDYNPDWAVLVDKGGEEKLYFVVETKGSTLEEDLRMREIDKMACGRKHFEALESNAEFRQSNNFEDFMESL